MNSTPQNPAPDTADTRSRGPTVRQLLIVVAILGITVLVTALTSDVNSALEPGIRLLNGQPDLPAVVGEWHSESLLGLTEDERKALPPDTKGARRVYRRADGVEVACSVVLAGRDVTSIHRPELCLPGQGWLIDYQTGMRLHAAAFPGGNLEVMRLDAKRQVNPQNEPSRIGRAMFAYWFIGKDRVTAHHWERILWTTKDRILHGRNHRWAYVLILVPVQADASGQVTPAYQERATQVMTSFVQSLYPLLMSPAS